MAVALTSGAAAGSAEMRSGADMASLSVASGKVASIDQGQKLVSIQTSPFTKKEFKLDDSAKITDGGKSLKLDQLQQGAEVTVQYSEGADGKDVAQEITVNAAKQGAKPAETGSAPAQSQAPKPAPAGSAPAESPLPATPRQE
jgi:hypothetical protein